ncbi:MAG: tRNA-dihydrouridine synthase family protein [Anaerolineaceae bacterium]|nr:tRNA-dihydrouridine synthase family protein [Anaerolineaceae bacterium]
MAGLYILSSWNGLFHPFNVGQICIESPLLQAPLDGWTNEPFRRITRELGAPLSITEFINGLDVVHKTPNLPQRIAYSESERPIVFQLFDDDPERLIESACILEERCHPDIFDVNMGCSARQVANRGAGAGLLRFPEKISRIISGMVSQLSVPVTAKIRLGWDDGSINYLEVGKIIQDCGASMITLHARTRKQEYSGHADWAAIGALKSSLTIPVVGNGDVETIADAQQMLKETGCDAVMVGRAMLRNPWIFAGYDFEEVPPDLFRETCRKHLQYNMEYYGEQWGCITFRKFAKRYLSRLNISKEEILSLMTTDDPDTFCRFFDDLLNRETI